MAKGEGARHAAQIGARGAVWGQVGRPCQTDDVVALVLADFQDQRPAGASRPAVWRTISR